MIRVAFIGAGQMARHHWSALERLPIRTEVVGVCDRSSAAADAFATTTASCAYPEAKDLLSATRPDVVHVCTPPSAHFEAARLALGGRAHVYVEKPFAMSALEATTLLDLARTERRLLCAGHQLLYDPAFVAMGGRLRELGELLQCDSHFAFRPAAVSFSRATARQLADQLIDVLPHPLYALVWMLDRSSASQPLEVAWSHADPAEVQAVLRAGPITGRLSVSLRARPVASSLTAIGTHGTLTCDFARSTLIGAGNTGTAPMEKVLNPAIEALQSGWGAMASAARRVRPGSAYAGLDDLMKAFYLAIASNGSSPISQQHLLHVSQVFETLTARINVTVEQTSVALASSPVLETSRFVVTGSRGFLGQEISRALPGRVRGISRRPTDADVNSQHVIADLSQGLSPATIAGAELVVHAAAETSGGYREHERNTVTATAHLLQAMRAAAVARLVLVSSLSTIRPPRRPFEQQHERTPRPRQPAHLGPYTWGKCLQEAMVERDAPTYAIATRVIRPGALIDWREPELPGIVGRQLFGRWHLGFGRPGLPVAVCDVRDCAKVIAWCATHFDDAPPVINLMDPSIATRGELIARLRAAGWNGVVVWVPVRLIAFGILVARRAIALIQRQRPAKLAAWSVLRPRRYDVRLSSRLFETIQRDTATAASIVTAGAGT